MPFRRKRSLGLPAGAFAQGREASLPALPRHFPSCSRPNRASPKTKSTDGVANPGYRAASHAGAHFFGISLSVFSMRTGLWAVENGWWLTRRGSVSAGPAPVQWPPCIAPDQKPLWRSIADLFRSAQKSRDRAMAEMLHAEIVVRTTRAMRALRPEIEAWHAQAGSLPTEAKAGAASGAAGDHDHGHAAGPVASRAGVTLARSS